MGSCNLTPAVPPTFNQALFLARYPEFNAYATANPASLGAMFLEAQLYFSLFSNPNALTYLNMLTAHIAFMGGALSADGQARPVGRISQASQGSVSASFDFTPATPGSGAWYAQSQYGAAFWAATANLRSAQYVAEPTFIGGPFPYGRGGYVG